MSTNQTVAVLNSLRPPEKLDETRSLALVSRKLTDEIAVARYEAGGLHGSGRELHRHARQQELELAQRQLAKRSPQELLNVLSDRGFAWRDLARMMGVSVPAIQKWRKGEGVSGSNRLKIAAIVAVCHFVAENYLVEHIASWFEMPIRSGVQVTPIDLYAGARVDLLLEYAAESEESSTLLDEFDCDWREKFVDSAFEVFEGDDGILSIRVKS